MDAILTFFNTIFEFLRDTFGQNIVFSVGLLLITGYFLAKMTAKIKLPPIGGYILAGLLLGESMIGLGLVPHGSQMSFSIITEVAIGILAVAIGSELSFKKLKRTGLKTIIITLSMIVVTFIMVFTAVFIFTKEPLLSLLLGLIACTTAPSVTLNVIKTLRVRGVFVDYVYGIVSISDAFMFLLFGLVIGVTTELVALGDERLTLLTALIPVAKILTSISLGIIIGFILNLILSKLKKLNEMLIVSLGMILLSTAIAISFELSFILTNLFLGITLINFESKNDKIFRVRVMYPFMPPIYSLFFAIAGISLDLRILGNIEVIIIMLLYIIIRALGKYAGVFIGSAIVKTDRRLGKYLGLCTLSQAGIAIGFTMVLESTPVLMGSYSGIIIKIINIILISVFVNQLLGKFLSRIAVVRAVNIEEEELGL